MEKEFNQNLDQIKKRLLDLSKRNKLINYRRPHKSKNLKFIDESPEFIFKYLVNDEKYFNFKPIPFPLMMPKYKALVKKREVFEENELLPLGAERRAIFYNNRWQSSMASKPLSPYVTPQAIEAFFKKQKRLAHQYGKIVNEIESIEKSREFTVESQAKELGLKVSSEMPEIELSNENNFDIHIDRFLQTLHYPDDLERILKKIELQSRSLMDVTGTNMLYLILGILEWRESNKPDVLIKSPLITIPVSLKRIGLNEKTNSFEYTLSYTGDVIETNESLSQKLFNDFRVKLPTLTEESSFNTYVKEVQKLCATQKGWKIKQEISLDFLQFGKVLMYKDLTMKENRKILESNTILRDIFLGRNKQESSYAVTEYDIDKEPVAKKMPLVLDADSSQHSAMVDVLKGKNVVIEGPPGSGKSQIIANLIALLMNEGKNVLFVSEKLVALEVVYQRLEQIGLGDFCLELHSEKTEKLEFLKNIGKRLSSTYPSPYKYEQNQINLGNIKHQLNEYLEILHRSYGKNSKTIFDNIWLRECHLEGEQYFLFDITNALNLKGNDLAYCEKELAEYVKYESRDSFWIGFDMLELSFMQTNDFMGLLGRLSKVYKEMLAELKALDSVALTPEDVTVLKQFLDTFEPVDEYYFPFAQKESFQNLENKLQAYLKNILTYLDASEINNLTTKNILESIETSSVLLKELLQFETHLEPELIAFEEFLRRSRESFDEFEEIEEANSKNLYLLAVNHKNSEEIYEIVHTVMNKRDSWFRFFSPSYKKSRNLFASMLKEKLPKNSDDWTFLLRELNLYTLNRENQLTLRLSLLKRVPIFIEKIESEGRYIKKSLETYNTIAKSPIAEQFKTLLYQDTKNVAKFNKLLSKNEELDNVLKHIAPYGTLTKRFYASSKPTFEELFAKLDKVEQEKSSLVQWLSYQSVVNKLKKLGLKEMILASEQGKIPHEKLRDVFYFNYYNSLVKRAFLEYPILENFDRIKQEGLVEEFRALDVKLIGQNRMAVAHKLSGKKLPPSEGEGRVATFTNMKLLRHEMGKKTRHVPIRQLLKRSGEAIHALKPCFMMSPLSVAQYVPIENSPFDVVLVDEASQMKPEESLGVIARAKQVVVVGDPKQLPPTSFFDVVQEETKAEEKSILDDSESLLDSFMELYSPVRRLKWHYRSQHESLISFSNRHFYDNELTIFPSASSKDDESLGVKYTYVEEGYYRSGNLYRTNEREAEKILETVVYQMENFPEKSLGVGTLNGTQQDLIQELVDEVEKENPQVSAYIEQWKHKNEAFFVKNLESLQGDERDVILISTTYAKEEGSSRLNQRFGPINHENGWRRLNVLITRSKQKMHIFTSMKSTEINVSDSSSRGLKALKNFLKFLERGAVTVSVEEREERVSSTFSKVLQKVLESRGIEVEANVGVSGYYIDLAIVSKVDGRYILAIECDGENYYGAKSSSDRDRLKSEALKRLGWSHYHVWSAEWYKNRELEIKRLLVKIEEAESSLDIKNDTILT